MADIIDISARLSGSDAGVVSLDEALRLLAEALAQEADVVVNAAGRPDLCACSAENMRALSAYVYEVRADLSRYGISEEAIDYCPG